MPIKILNIVSWTKRDEYLQHIWDFQSVVPEYAYDKAAKYQLQYVPQSQTYKRIALLAKPIKSQYESIGIT